MGIRNPNNIRTTLSADHWATLMDAIRRCGSRHVQFSCVDLSALDHNALRVALIAAVFTRLRDDLVRASVGKGLVRLELSGNQHDTWQRLSDDAVLDFFFRADAPAGGQSLSLRLAGTGLTGMFLKKFIERLQSSSARRPSGILTVNGGGAKLRGLSAYARYLTPSGIHGRNATYRFPPADNTNKSFEVAISGSSNSFRMKFHASE
ncbi:hypothetical protein AAVH_34534 [Aphelenchoides avenae]|nr:hypothetical protein AAVH_34534 [Aphelenchus avenae]